MESHERISWKLTKFGPSLTLALKHLTDERRRKGLPVYDFGLGETKGNLDSAIREAGERAFHNQESMYSDPAGLPELRQAVLRWLDVERHYSVENVVISTGAKQSLFNIFLALCNPSDCVLFDSAPWVSYQPLAIAAYAFPVQVLPLERRDRDLKCTPADLRRNLAVRPHARLFLLNNPVNPTAQLYSRQEVEGLLQVCVEHKLFFVLDRLYWRIVFDGAAYPEPPIDEETKPWLIQVDGLSKNWRRTGGLRIGWCVAPEDVARAMVNLQSHTTSGPATPTQRAAQAAISSPYNAGLKDELQNKRNLLHREAKGIPHIEIWPTPATFYSFWDVRPSFGMKTPEGRTLQDSDQVAEYLVTHAGVVTASGRGFMQDGYLRLSFATPDDQIVEGIRAAREAFAALRT